MIPVESGRAQLHIHPDKSDGLASIESILETAKRLGMNIIAITAHDQFKPAEKAKNLAVQTNSPVTIVTGIEITASFNFDHVLAFFPDGIPSFDKTNMFMGVERTVDWVHEKGGLAILAHPQTSLFFRLHREKCRMFNGLEVFGPMNPKGKMDLFVPFQDRLAFVAGGDIHFVNDPGWNYLTIFPGTTIPELMSAIRNKQTIPFLNDFNLPQPSLRDQIRQTAKAIAVDPIQTGRIFAVTEKVKEKFKK